MSTSLHICKIGGKMLQDDQQQAEALAYFQQIDGPKILVHGGGPKANELIKQLQLQPQMHQGRRITDGPTLEVVVMVYAGLLNTSLVGNLQQLGCNAIGLSGADGNLLLATTRPPQPIDFGYVGDIQQVNVQLLQQLLAIGLTPVCCAITHDGQGQLLNTNADTIATQLAIALAPHFDVSLHFCFEKPGVLQVPTDDQSVIARLSPSSFEHYKQEGVIANGMLPKLHNAFSALPHQLREIKIGNPTSIQEGYATTICA
ncbi:MAG: acetylglutamate kinase [Bacteroidota bacterium]